MAFYQSLLALFWSQYLKNNRSLYGVFDEEVEIHGVKGWKVTTPKEIFESPQKNPYNDCFCHHNNSILCHHDGGISLQACQHGKRCQAKSII